MVAHRFDPTQGGEENATPAAAANSATAAAPQPRGSVLTAWLPLVVAVVIMPALAYAMTTWVLVPKLRKELALPGAVSAAAKEGHEDNQHPGDPAAAQTGRETMALSKLLVNVAGTMGSRYLLTSLTLVSHRPNFKTKIEKNDPQLRDVACGILSSKTITDLEQPGARNLIRNELIAAFNNIIGLDAVKEIYFTEFAIQ